MSIFNLKTAALAIAAGVGLSGCAYGPYGGLGVGVGYGNGYDGYYGNGYYGGGYPYGYAGYNSPYGYGYGSPYYGWNNGYYYPGTGYYVYDRYRNSPSLVGCTAPLLGASPWHCDFDWRRRAGDRAMGRFPEPQPASSPAHDRRQQSDDPRSTDPSGPAGSHGAGADRAPRDPCRHSQPEPRTRGSRRRGHGQD